MTTYKVYARSHRGNVRKNNQDNLFCNGVYKAAEEDRFEYSMEAGSDQRLLIAVFDGMGGMQAGEQAALIACEGLNEYGWSKEEDLEYAIRVINRNMCLENDRRGITMGSTCVILENGENGIRSHNVGDSRAYLFRKGELILLSEDHTEEGMVFVSGSAVDDSDRHPMRSHVLTQFLGIDENEFIIEPFVSEWIEPENKDVFILCSDGLYGSLDDDSIAETLSQSEDVETASRKLEEKALHEGGVDNITIVALEVSNI